MESGCRRCGKPIDASRAKDRRVRFCSSECQRLFWLERKAGRRDLRPVTISRIHELTVTADLMKRGFRVYQASGPNCECDIVFPTRDSRWIRVVIRAGYDNDRGGAVPFNRPAKGTFDVLAVVSGLGITYLPPLESLTQRPTAP